MGRNKANKVDQYFAEFGFTGADNYDKDGNVRVFMWMVMDADGAQVKGRTIEEFKSYMIELSRQRRIFVWFHNLGLHFSFLEYHFHSDRYGAHYKRELPTRYLKTTFGREYTAIRNYANELFAVEWFTGKDSWVSLRDSSKVFPTTLRKIRESSGRKWKVFKESRRYMGRYDEACDSDWDRVEQNIDTARVAMCKQFDRYGTIKLTRSSYAFDALKIDYNEDNTPKNFKGCKKYPTYFDKVFPKTEPDDYTNIRSAYFGGIVYIDKGRKGKYIGKGATYDVNSLYPYVMTSRRYPKGKHVEFKGGYYSLDGSIREKYDVYVQSIFAEFTLKEGGFPSLPKKLSRGRTEVYSHDDLRGLGSMTLTSIDLEHFMINYDIEHIEFIGGYMWESIDSPFKKFIDEMYAERLKHKKSGDKISEMMTKMDMNASYGKFGQSPFSTTRLPFIDFDEAIGFKTEDEEPRAKNYLPMAIFVTAYARDVLLNAIYSVGINRVIYADTDSIHVEGWETPEGIEIDSTGLGKWKLEGKWESGKFLKEKHYAHEYEDDKGRYIVVKASSLTDEAKENIRNLEEFSLGREFLGNQVSKLVKGGYLITNIGRTLGLDIDNIDIADGGVINRI